MAIKNRLKVAKLALSTLNADRVDHLLRIDDYARGRQDPPFMPDNADAEYKLLANRAQTNVIPFLLNTSAQMLYADSFRRGNTSTDGDGQTTPTKVQRVQPEWDHWQRSRLDARQAAVYRGALTFGHSFVLTEKVGDNVISKGLSALKTVALYEDPANDDNPYASLSVTRWPTKASDTQDETLGLARMWDDTYHYWVTFKSLDDINSIVVKAGTRHGATINPVTRFTAAVDLEGRTVGVVEPMFQLQDRINQTVFDLLIVQSFASFKVRTISGMAPPIKYKAIDADGNTIERPDLVPEEQIADWVPVVDPNTGRPVLDEVNLNAKRLFFAEDHETKFGTLDETPLDGFIRAIELGFRHMAALSQTPPHHILGEISNLSAEALEAAETALLRKCEEFKSSFGESWERVFRVYAEIAGVAGADDFNGEIIWRDQGNASLAQAADAYGKIAEQLGVPPRGLWGRIPNVTANELAYWEQLDDDRNASGALADGVRRTTVGTRPGFRLAEADAA